MQRHVLASKSKPRVHPWSDNRRENTALALPPPNLRRSPARAAKSLRNNGFPPSPSPPPLLRASRRPRRKPGLRVSAGVELWQLAICCGSGFKMGILKPHGNVRRRISGGSLPAVGRTSCAAQRRCHLGSWRCPARRIAALPCPATLPPETTVGAPEGRHDRQHPMQRHDRRHRVVETVMP